MPCVRKGVGRRGQGARIVDARGIPKVPEVGQGTRGLWCKGQRTAVAEKTRVLKLRDHVCNGIDDAVRDVELVVAAHRGHKLAVAVFRNTNSNHVLTNCVGDTRNHSSCRVNAERRVARDWLGRRRGRNKLNEGVRRGRRGVRSWVARGSARVNVAELVKERVPVGLSRRRINAQLVAQAEYDGRNRRKRRCRVAAVVH